jgi:hypothetical protein
LVLYNGIDRDDLSSIRSATGQDAASVSCDPKLQAPTGNAATVDLHIQASPVVTQVEGNGAAIGTVTDDFDGQTRSTLTPNDIGADAGNFTAFVNPVLLQQIGSSFSDITTGTLVLAGWLLLVKALLTPNWPRLAGSGLLLAVATALKPTNAIPAFAAEFTRCL